VQFVGLCCIIILLYTEQKSNIFLYTVISYKFRPLTWPSSGKVKDKKLKDDKIIEVTGPIQDIFYVIHLNHAGAWSKSLNIPTGHLPSVQNGLLWCLHLSTFSLYVFHWLLFYLPAPLFCNYLITHYKMSYTHVFLFIIGRCIPAWKFCVHLPAIVTLL
jgi:hypothetical protein